MDIIVILLRILHIFSGVFWVGSGWMFVFFVEPTVSVLGPEGGKFVNNLVTVRKYPLYVSIAAGTTILAGIILYVIKWGPVWSTPRGLTFLIGGLFGIAAGAVGGMVGGLTGRLTTLGGEIAKQGKPPSADQAAQMRALQERLRSLGRLTAVLTTIALLCMASARYMPA